MNKEDKRKLTLPVVVRMEANLAVGYVLYGNRYLVPMDDLDVRFSMEYANIIRHGVENKVEEVQPKTVCMPHTPPPPTKHPHHTLITMVLCRGSVGLG